MVILHYYVVEWFERDLVVDEGVGITGVRSGPLGKTIQECKKWCDENYDCNSIAWNPPGDCYLKEKCLTEDDPWLINKKYKSYYKPCAGSGMSILIHIPDLSCFMVIIC